MQIDKLREWPKNIFTVIICNLYDSVNVSHYVSVHSFVSLSMLPIANTDALKVVPTVMNSSVIDGK